MKAYVATYALREPDAASEAQEYDVHYAEKPGELKFSTIAEADAGCSALNNMHVKAGSHCCEFQVEEIASESFAVTCPNHPVRGPFGGSRQTF